MSQANNFICTEIRTAGIEVLSHHSKEKTFMSILKVKDGTDIYYNDWGTGQPIVFSHGWPLSADAFEDQMNFLVNHGYRCIAHDRRGHGRSSQPWNGNDLDTYADDLAALTEALDLKNAIHVGHSTGGGEVARYIGRYGTKRVRRHALFEDRQRSNLQDLPRRSPRHVLHPQRRDQRRPPRLHQAIAIKSH
jgi:pimeloyl-ACP methyl ester carboxylesterase